MPPPNKPSPKPNPVPAPFRQTAYISKKMASLWATMPSPLSVTPIKKPSLSEPSPYSIWISGVLRILRHYHHKTKTRPSKTGSINPSTGVTSLIVIAILQKTAQARESTLIILPICVFPFSRNQSVFQSGHIQNIGHKTIKAIRFLKVYAVFHATMYPVNAHKFPASR